MLYYLYQMLYTW